MSPNILKYITWLVVIVITILILLFFHRYCFIDHLIFKEIDNNNNNNLFFKVTTKPHQIGVWDPLVCGTRDPLRPMIWLVKSTEVYIPYPLLDLNLSPLKKKHMFLTTRPTQTACKRKDITKRWCQQYLTIYLICTYI